jgi:small redox-active disulfide protein 2
VKIQVLGPGCPNCKQLHKNTMAAVIEADVDADVEKVEDIATIMKFGVMSTPALVVDGVVKTSGKVLSVAEIKKLIA